MRISSSELEARIREVYNQNQAVIKNDEVNRAPAAVLIPFVLINDEWNLLFTKRTNGVAKHQGEISFPGGAAEAGDVDLIQTAVRESCEEIGVCEDSIRIVTVMTPVPTVSNYCVLPVIGIIEWPLTLTLNKDEVESILLIPVEWLKKEENWYEQDFYYAPGKSKQVIHYHDYNGEHLWGITARLALEIVSKI